MTESDQKASKSDKSDQKRTLLITFFTFNPARDYPGCGKKHGKERKREESSVPQGVARAGLKVKKVTKR